MNPLQNAVFASSRFWLLAWLVPAMLLGWRAPAQSATFAADAQHSGQFGTPAQHLNQILWTTPIVAYNDYGAHHPAPLITPSNTVIVSVVTFGGFQLNAFSATGQLKYTLATDYVPQPNSPAALYQPVLATSPSSARLYYPAAGGTLYYIENPDSTNHGPPVRVCFYTNVAAYAANAGNYNASIFINTPLTADTEGNIFFGFRVPRTAPPPLNNSTNAGFARVDPSGQGVFIHPGSSQGYNDSLNSAPALSPDGATLYVVVKSSDSFGYLVGLNSSNLVQKYVTILRDPRNATNFAALSEYSTASPTVGPDGDVFFGVLANPANNERGYLLHFSSDLHVTKPPGGFGWDYTPAIVPSSMVPGYTGSSSYLLFTKYNNYVGDTDGNGINRVALLDPQATQIDPHSTARGLAEMREVQTVIGATPDTAYLASYPYAVREWCINAGAINPATHSIFFPSEDGRIYRWNLAANSLSETLPLTWGLGEGYVPTAIGPDGIVYTLNGTILYALGGFTNLDMEIFSSSPDLRAVVAGQTLVFTAVVTNLDPLGDIPTGTVTFQDVTYGGTTRITNTLAANVPLVNGVASVTNSSLTAGGSYLGNHFITATYNPDKFFPSASATLMQKVHAYATTTTLSTAERDGWGDVILTAVVVPDPAGAGTPTGLVSFWDGSRFLGQTPLNQNYLTGQVATLSVSSLSAGLHAFRASYVSDTVFAASTGSATAVQPLTLSASWLTNGVFQISFTNTIGTPFSVLAGTDLTLPLSAWTELGPAMETFPGQFQFTDPISSNSLARFYVIRSSK